MNVYEYLYVYMYICTYIYIFIYRFKVGLGISRTNADSQWNPVYNVFHTTSGLAKKICMYTYSYINKHACRSIHACHD